LIGGSFSYPHKSHMQSTSLPEMIVHYSI